MSVDAAVDVIIPWLEGDGVGDCYAVRHFESRIQHSGQSHPSGCRPKGVRSRDANSALEDCQRPVPGRVSGAEHQGAEVVLLQGIADRGKGERAGERERLTLADLDARAGGIQVEGARGAERVGDAEAVGQAVRADADDIGRVTKGAIVRHGKITAGDVDDRGRSAEGIGAGEGQRAGAGLGQHDVRRAGHATRNHAGQAKAVGKHRGARAADAVGDAGGSSQGEAVGQKKSVVVAVRQRDAEVRVRKRGRLQDLVKGLIEGESAGPSDGHVRHHAGLEDDVADGERLERAGAVAIVVNRDRRTVSQAGRVEITRVTGGIEHQSSEAASRYRGDVGDVIDPAEQLDREIRVVDLDGEGAVGEAGKCAVERQCRSRRHRAVEGRRPGETDLVADVLTRSYDQLAAGRDVQASDADRAADHPEDAGGSGGRIAAQQQTAGVQVEVSRKRALGAQLQDAIARLGDRRGRGAVLDDRRNVQGGDEWREIDGRSREQHRSHADGVGPGRQGDGAGDSRNLGRVARSRRDGRGAREGKHTTGGDRRGRVAAEIGEREAVERIVTDESQGARAVDRDI